MLKHRKLLCTWYIIGAAIMDSFSYWYENYYRAFGIFFGTILKWWFWLIMEQTFLSKCHLDIVLSEFQKCLTYMTLKVVKICDSSEKINVQVWPRHCDACENFKYSVNEYKGVSLLCWHWSVSSTLVLLIHQAKCNQKLSDVFLVKYSWNVDRFFWFK